MRQQPRAKCVDNGMWGVGGTDSGVIYYSFSIKHLETKREFISHHCIYFDVSSDLLSSCCRCTLPTVCPKKLLIVEGL